MNRKLQDDEVTTLIQLFHTHESLWDQRNPNYRRKDLRTQALKEIADEMGLTVEFVKKKIKSLRSTYILQKKKLEKMNSGCEVDDLYEPSLSWFNQMEFLDKSIISRKLSDPEDPLGSPNKKRRLKEQDSPTHSQIETFEQSAFNQNTYNNDEAEIHARAWAIEYRKLSPDQQLLAKRKIDNILFQGRLEQLSLNNSDYDSQENYQ